MSLKFQDTLIINDSREAANLNNITVQGIATISGTKTDPIQTISCSSGAGVINCALGNYFELTNITQSSTSIDYTNTPGGLYCLILKVNPNTSTFNWPATYTWKNSTLPTMSSTNTHFVFLYTLDSLNWDVSFLTFT